MNSRPASTVPHILSRRYKGKSLGGPDKGPYRTNGSFEFPRPRAYSPQWITTVIWFSIIGHLEGRGLYVHFATASRTCLSMSATPELRKMLTSETVPSSWTRNFTVGDRLYDSPGSVLNGPFGNEPWIRTVLAHSGGGTCAQELVTRPIVSSTIPMVSFIDS